MRRAKVECSIPLCVLSLFLFLVATGTGDSQTEVDEYQGSCVKGTCVGSVGTWMWKSLDMYTGQFDENGYRHGTGIFRWNATKDIYEGAFVNGLPDGAGVYLWGTGTQEYVGQFYPRSN